jgi:hypothetical protein
MKNTQEPSQCQHEACSCPLPETEGNYCSENCEEAAKGGISEGCQCGHADCS